MPEEIDGLLHSANAATKTIAAALKQLAEKQMTISTDECLDAVTVLMEREFSEMEQKDSSQQSGPSAGFSCPGM